MYIVHVGEFRYTCDNTILTPEQRQFYEENGFLVIRRLVSQENITKFYERFKQICEKKVKVGVLTFVHIFTPVG